MTKIKHYKEPLDLKGTVKVGDVELLRLPIKKDFKLGVFNEPLRKSFVNFVWRTNKGLPNSQKFKIRTFEEDGFLWCERRK